MMKFDKRSRLNLGLVLVVIVLGVLSRFRPGTKHPAAPVPLVAMKAAQINDIRIQLPGQTTTELLHDNRSWRMVAPRAMPADPNQVRTLLDYLDAESQTRFPASGTDLSHYGLTKPVAKLWLNGREYDFGGLQPVDNLQYVLTGGEIHLINGALFYRVAHDAYWWMDKSLLPIGSHITAMQLPHATLSLDKKGMWRLAPADDSVSADAIQGLLDAWQQDLAIAVMPIGKDPEEGEVSLSIANASQPIRFAILKDPDFLVLARPDLGLQYELDSSFRDTLLGFQKPKPKPAH